MMPNVYKLIAELKDHIRELEERIAYLERNHPNLFNLP